MQRINNDQGREYKYIAKANSTPFKDAPKVVTRAMGRLNWAAKVSLNGKPFAGLNEVLVVGYFVEMGMGVSLLVTCDGQPLIKYV